MNILNTLQEFFTEMLSGFASGDPKFIVSQVAAIITGVLAIFCVQVNKPLHILYMQLAVNLTTIASHLFNGAGAGTALIVVAVVHLVFNCYFNLKGKNPPRISSWLFAIPYVGSVIIASEYIMKFSYTEFGFWIDAMLIAASIFFMLAVAQRKASGYRFFILLNTLIWLVYDFYGGTDPNVMMMITHIGLLISNIVAIVRLDILGKHTAESEPKPATPIET